MYEAMFKTDGSGGRYNADRNRSHGAINKLLFSKNDDNQHLKISAYEVTMFYLCAAMRRHIHNARDLLLPVIDFFYPPFRKLMNIQTFRYAASGGANTLLGFIVYFISFEYIFKGKEFHFDFYAFKPHSAALFTSFCVTFPIGFFMSKYVVFSDSKMKGRIQLFRYFMICMFN